MNLYDNFSYDFALILNGFKRIFQLSNQICLYNARNKMINGVNLSEIYEVKHTHLNHCQRLNQIINHDRSYFSLMSRQQERVVQNHKTLHNHWRKYRSKRHNIQIQRDNEAFKKRIETIKMRKSRYSIKQSESMPAKGHNFYIRRKKQLSIDIQNPEIANRIINAQGSLSLTKNNAQESERLVYRLQKFPMMKRMIELSQKKLHTQMNEIQTPLDKLRPSNLHNRKYKSAYKVLK